eukprot:487837-Rhodomonas_salina.1
MHPYKFTLLSKRMVLQKGYAMSGTEIAYGATLLSTKIGYGNTGFGTKIAYGATRYAVLSYHIVLGNAQY